MSYAPSIVPSPEALDVSRQLVRMAITVLQNLGTDPTTAAQVIALTIGKSDDPVGDPRMVEKEIGDVLLSVLNLGTDTDPSSDTETPKDFAPTQTATSPLSPHPLDAVLPHGTQETVASVRGWCEKHYPGESRTKRTINLLEETVELALVLGVSPQGLSDMIAAPTQSYMLWHMAMCSLLLGQNLGIPAGVAMDRVMAHNRGRQVSESQARSARKQALGMVDPTA